MGDKRGRGSHTGWWWWWWWSPFNRGVPESTTRGGLIAAAPCWHTPHKALGQNSRPRAISRLTSEPGCWSALCTTRRGCRQPGRGCRPLPCDKGAVGIGRLWASRLARSVVPPSALCRATAQSLYTAVHCEHLARRPNSQADQAWQSRGQAGWQRAGERAVVAEVQDAQLRHGASQPGGREGSAGQLVGAKLQRFRLRAARQHEVRGVEGRQRPKRGVGGECQGTPFWPLPLSPSHQAARACGTEQRQGSSAAACFYENVASSAHAATPSLGRRGEGKLEGACAPGSPPSQAEGCQSTCCVSAAVRGEVEQARVRPGGRCGAWAGGPARQPCSPLGTRLHLPALPNPWHATHTQLFEEGERGKQAGRQRAAQGVVGQLPGEQEGGGGARATRDERSTGRQCDAQQRAWHMLLPRHTPLPARHPCQQRHQAVPARHPALPAGAPTHRLVSAGKLPGCSQAPGSGPVSPSPEATSDCRRGKPPAQSGGRGWAAGAAPGQLTLPARETFRCSNAGRRLTTARPSSSGKLCAHSAGKPPCTLSRSDRWRSAGSTRGLGSCWAACCAARRRPAPGGAARAAHPPGCLAAAARLRASARAAPAWQEAWRRARG